MSYTSRIIVKEHQVHIMVCHCTLPQVIGLTHKGQDTRDQGRDITRKQAWREETATSELQTNGNILKEIEPLATYIETIESCLTRIINDLREVKHIANVSECLTEDSDELVAKWNGIREVSGSESRTISPFHYNIALILGNLKMSLELCLSY